jgi:hypothetical protein
MNTHADAQLVDELNNLLVVKLALVLVPTQRVLQILSHEGLATAMGKITSDVTADLEFILPGYNISRRANHNESDDL